MPCVHLEDNVAKLVIADRIVPAWLEVARHLDRPGNRTDRNLILEIDSPTSLSAEDLEIIRRVDKVLLDSKSGIGVFTVANTLFPQGIYHRSKPPEFYARAVNAIRLGNKKHVWGTYALRMMERTHPKTKKVVNPLETIVSKLKEAKAGRKVQAAYELGVHDAVELLEDEVACELPIHEPATDGPCRTNIPCLSHLSFKLDIKNNAVDLTAVYRSHYYAQRALGNLLGLSQLLAFVAKETGHKVGVLTCISTLAVLDAENFGGAAATTNLLATM